MRRLLLLVVAGALAVVAVTLPRPEAPEGPSFTGAAVIDDIAGAQGSVWYCPWMNAGAIRDAYLMLGTVPNVEVEVTLPSPVPNEDADRALSTILGPGAEALEVASIVRRGDAPGFVEFDDGPAAVSAVVTSDSIVTGDRCVASVPKLWHLPGGTTRPGRLTTLRLFNPFPEAAKVTVAGTSEFGEVGLVGLTSLDVPGRVWEDIDLNEIVPLLDDLSLTVSAEEGLVIPSLVVSTDLDEASWPGTGLSPVWEFPVVTQTGLVPSLIISNPGDAEAQIEVDVYTSEGSVEAVRTAVAAPRTPVRIEIGDLADRFFAIRVRASEPVSAVVVAEDLVQSVAEEAQDPEEVVAQRIAGTVGVPEPANRWLLTGPGGVRTATSTMWIMNSGANPVTVSILPLGSQSGTADKVQLEGGTVRRVVLSQASGVSGYLLEAQSPISAAWSIEAGDGVAFVSGISIDG